MKSEDVVKANGAAMIDAVAFANDQLGRYVPHNRDYRCHGHVRKPRDERRPCQHNDRSTIVAGNVSDPQLPSLRKRSTQLSSSRSG